MRPSKAIAVTLAGALLAAGGAQAQDAQALLEKYRCNVCHATQESRTGPTYVDIAQRYRGDAKATAALSAAIRQGERGAGPWHMPPHPEISEAEARTMVRYILALRQ